MCCHRKRQMHFEGVKEPMCKHFHCSHKVASVWVYLGVFFSQV